MLRWIGLFSVLIALCWAPVPLFAQAPEDAAAYLEVVERSKKVTVEEQLNGWRSFLQEHPDTSFRPEIERNIQNLENLLTQTDPSRQREEKDAERYLRAVEFAKKLSLSDQLALWEQFIEENPKSLYRNDAEATAKTLKGRLRKEPKKPSAVPSPSEQGTPARLEIARRLPYKDQQTATLLAIFPGLVVPGIGHWYTRDYVMGGVLTGLRVGGLAVGLPGVIQENNSLIIIGSILAGFSYLVDIADAPFSVRRYNENLENTSQKTSWLGPSEVPLEGSLAFSIEF